MCDLGGSKITQNIIVSNAYENGIIVYISMIFPTQLELSQTKIVCKSYRNLKFDWDIPSWQKRMPHGTTRG